MASSFKAKVQKMGGFLSGMVMPNIGCPDCMGYYHSIIYSDRIFPK